MNISDLNLCEIVDFPNKIVGGVSANADGYAIAGPGWAVAYVTAEASGDYTLTDVKASTNVRENKRVTISKAKIKGDAWAVDADGNQAKDKIRDNDVYVMHHD